MDRPDAYESDEEVNEKAIRGLATRPNVYTRANQLVRVVYDATRPLMSFVDESNPTVQLIPKANLRGEIDGGCKFVRWNGKSKKLVKVSVPDSVVSAVHSYGRFEQIDPLVFVTRTPRFLPNGELLTEPGYHRQSGIYYHPHQHFQLGELLSVSEAKHALAETIQDFPFADEAHRSAFYSGVLSILARPAYRGCTPLHLADANQAGSGKGLLWDVAATIALGYPLPRMTLSNADETKKAITACVFAADPAFLLDNLTGTLKSAHLDALLTSEKWKDRILGVSEVKEIDWHGIVFATGNNLKVPRDTFRRVVYARLKSPLANPELRDNFAIPRLKDYVKAHRARLTTAALSVLWHWHQARRPRQAIPAWGSYEGWSDVVRQCMTWAELGDPILTSDSLRDADSETNLLAQLIEAWEEVDTVLPSRYGNTVGNAVDRLEKLPKLREVLDEFPGRDIKTELGKTMGKYKDRVCGGKCIIRSAGAHAKWKVVSV